MKPGEIQLRTLLNKAPGSLGNQLEPAHQRNPFHLPSAAHLQRIEARVRPGLLAQSCPRPVSPHAACALISLSLFSEADTGWGEGRQDRLSWCLGFLRGCDGLVRDLAPKWQKAFGRKASGLLHSRTFHSCLHLGPETLPKHMSSQSYPAPGDHRSPYPTSCSH